MGIDWNFYPEFLKIDAYRLDSVLKDRIAPFDAIVLKMGCGRR